MVHRNTVERYSGTLANLAVDLADLRYDALIAFLRCLSSELDSDAGADEQRGRPRLAGELRAAAAALAAAADVLERAWRICEPRM